MPERTNLFLISAQSIEHENSLEPPNIKAVPTNTHDPIKNRNEKNNLIASKNPLLAMYNVNVIYILKNHGQKRNHYQVSQKKPEQYFTLMDLIFYQICSISCLKCLPLILVLSRKYDHYLCCKESRVFMTPRRRFIDFSALA